MVIDEPVGLYHILDAAKEAVFLSRNIKRSEIEINRKIANSMVECLELIGEAAACIPPERQEELSEIPWQKLINIRKYLSQTKLEINLDMIWEIVTKDLPLWINQLDPILARESKALMNQWR